MGTISDPFFSKGDQTRRIDELYRLYRQLRHARRLEHSSIGRGGLTVRGGFIRCVDEAGKTIFEIGGNPRRIVMAPELIADLARQVISETLLTAQEFGIGTRNNTEYGDLSGIDPGPVIAEVPISATGKAVVALSCATTVDIGAGLRGFMSVRATGPTVREPDDQNAYVVGLGGDPALDVTATGQATELVILDGLAPGEYMFTAKFRTLTTGGAVTFINPQLAVWAF